MTRRRITRTIAIDAGHRIMTHGSKCRNLHGHRYSIEVACEALEGQLQSSGEQSGMVLDFGFLKEEMFHHIDTPCDHGFILSAQDSELLEMFAPVGQDLNDWIEEIRARVDQHAYWATTQTRLKTKLYIVPFQPTAECLAEHWFNRLKEPVSVRSGGLAEICKVKVWETPNCWAEFS